MNSSIKKLDEGISDLKKMGADMLEIAQSHSTTPSDLAVNTAAKTLSESILRVIGESPEYPDREKMQTLYEQWKKSINNGKEINDPTLEILEKYSSSIKCKKFISKCDYLSGILFEYYKKKSGVNVPPAASSLPTQSVPTAASSPPVHSRQHFESNTSRESFDSHNSDSDVSVVGENRGGKKRKSMKRRKQKSRKTKNVYKPLSRRGK